MKTKKFNVWMEGYMANGDSAPHRFIGTAEAKTFKEASYIALKKWRESLGCNDIDEYYDPKYNTFWGMRCFDNEIDASKSFG